MKSTWTFLEYPYSKYHKKSSDQVPCILKQKFVYEIKRPKKDKKLLVVLSQEEVLRILMLIYSAGLRVSEVARLKVEDIEDIDLQRKLIYVKDAKGRKNRYTILSDVAIETLNLYMKSYLPERWLFLS